MSVFLKAAMEREKRKVPYERAVKTGLETGVKSNIPFCFGPPPIEKTNSETFYNLLPPWMGYIPLAWFTQKLCENFYGSL